jgi:hypothetical protein
VIVAVGAALLIDRALKASREPEPVAAVSMPNSGLPIPFSWEPKAPMVGEDVEEWRTRKLATGNPAPDFPLVPLDGGTVGCLRDLRGKTPVVLLFGSFGCNVFCQNLSRFTQLARDYRDRAAFYFVYCPEGPHKDFFPSLPGEDPPARVRRGLKQFGVSIPCVLGNDIVQTAFDTFPARVVVLDRSGRIALDLGRPSEWKEGDLETWLKEAPLLCSSPPQSPCGPRKKSPLSAAVFPWFW